MGWLYELLDHGFDEMRFSGQIDVVDSMTRASSIGI